MVARGYAIRFRDRDPDFEIDERCARDNRIGIWAGTLIPPAQWRKESALTLEEAKRRVQQYQAAMSPASDRPTRGGPQKSAISGAEPWPGQRPGN
jgi:hypothetical protein